MIEDHKWYDSRVMLHHANDEYIRIIPDEYICEINKADVIAMADHFGLYVSNRAPLEDRLSTDYKGLKLTDEQAQKVYNTTMRYAIDGMKTSSTRKYANAMIKEKDK